MRDIADLFQRLRHLLVEHPPIFGFSAIVRNKKAGTCETRVIVTLAIVFWPDGDIVRLAFNDDEWILGVGFVFCRAPDYEVCAGMS